MLTPTHSTDDLIETIYSCALNLADWRQVCEEIGRLVPGVGIGLQLVQVHDHRNVGVVHHGFDSEAVPSYLSHYIGLNPWLSGLERRPVGMLTHASDLCPTEDLLRTEFWNDWLKPQGDFAAGSAIVLSKANDRNCALVTNYSHRSPGMREQVDDLLLKIGPHMCQAFDLWRRSAVEREQVGIYEGAFGTILLPLVLVDDNRRMRLANESAEAILRRNDGLMLAANHEVRAADRKLDAKLGRAISDVVNSPVPKATPILLEKSGDGEKFGHYVVSVFPSGHRKNDLGFGNFSFFDDQLAVLAIHDTTSNLKLEHRILSETFGLTETEAALACFLLDGGTLADYARERCVSRYTVRNQLGAIMRKTSTHRQADLVGLLTRIALTS